MNDRHSLREACSKRMTELGVRPDIQTELLDVGKWKGLNRLTFKQLLRRLAETIGLEIDDDTIRLFVTSRNALVHHGDFSGSKQFASKFDEYLFDLNVLDRFFLGLIGCRGPARDFRTLLGTRPA